jgi:transcriptional regulator with XRE-family HTH domain
LFVRPFDTLMHMRYEPLDNYIEMHRLRTGLSQDDVAYLIGVERGASVSRYEQGIRLPDLVTALALEIVLGQPVRELYLGRIERMRQDVALRARELLESLDDTPTPELSLKLEVLGKLARPDDPSIIPVWGE